MPLRRYACPACGGGLSRTLVHPKWLSLEAEKPEFQMPLKSILFAVVVLGIGLGLVHPALGMIGTFILLNWIYWRYFSWLQCDACSRFYFGGQLTGKPTATRPWTRVEIRALALKIGAAGGVLLLVFIPLRYVEKTTQVNCTLQCKQTGMSAAVFLNQCKCVPAVK